MNATKMTMATIPATIERKMTSLFPLGYTRPVQAVEKQPTDWARNPNPKQAKIMCHDPSLVKIRSRQMAFLGQRAGVEPSRCRVFKAIMKSWAGIKHEFSVAMGDRFNRFSIDFQLALKGEMKMRQGLISSRSL